MKLVLILSALSLLGPTSAEAADRFGEVCSGAEVVQIGSQAPRRVPFHSTFSVDLAANIFCYDKCGPDQRFAISDASSDPMKLVDLHAGQVREMTLDRRTGTFSDYQSFDAGVARIVRTATARCHLSEFHEPARPPRPAL